MASPKTLTVIGPHGSEVTVLKPGLGKVIVIAHSGATPRHALLSPDAATKLL